MPENNQMMSVEGQLVGLPIAGPESFSQQQIEYLKRALGVDETVLWDCGGTPQQSPALTLSEPYTNFKTLRFKLAGGTAPGTYVWNSIYIYLPTDSIAAVNRFNLNYTSSDSTQGTSFVYKQLMYNVASTTSFTVQGNGQVFYNGSSWSAKTNVTTLMWQVVGIGRIAGGN